MAEEYLPTRRARYGEGRQSLKEIGFEDVAAFIAADTPEKLGKYALSCPGLFGDRAKARVSDAKAARGLLVLALKAKEASAGEGPSPETLAEYGVVVNAPSEGVLSLMEAASELEAAAAELANELGPGGADLLLGGSTYRRGSKAAAPLMGATFSWDVPAGGYADYLFAAIMAEEDYDELLGAPCPWDCVWYAEDSDGIEREVDPDDADGLQVICALGYFERSAEGARKCLSDLVDRLFTLHLADVRTVSLGGGRECRIVATGISSLWWCAIDSLRDGRLGACEVCGKPYVARGERGKPRKYCSDACRQWHKNHPGEKRASY